MPENQHSPSPPGRHIAHSAAGRVCKTAIQTESLSLGALKGKCSNNSPWRVAGVVATYDPERVLNPQAPSCAWEGPPRPSASGPQHPAPSAQPGALNVTPARYLAGSHGDGHTAPLRLGSSRCRHWRVYPGPSLGTGRSWSEAAQRGREQAHDAGVGVHVPPSHGVAGRPSAVSFPKRAHG